MLQFLPNSNNKKMTLQSYPLYLFIIFTISKLRIRVN